MHTALAMRNGGSALPARAHLPAAAAITRSTHASIWQRETAAQGTAALLDLGAHGGIVKPAEHPRDETGDLVHLPLAHTP